MVSVENLEEDNRNTETKEIIEKDQKMCDISNIDYNNSNNILPIFNSLKPKLIFNNKINDNNNSDIYKEDEITIINKNDIFDRYDFIDENEMEDQISNCNNSNSFLEKSLPESEKLLKKEQKLQKQQQHQSIQQYSMLYLPQEIIFHIFQFLDVHSLVQISSSNSLLQLIGNDNELWKKMSIERYGCSPVVPKPYFPLWKTYFKSFQIYKGIWDSNKKGKIFITNNYKTITHAGDYLGSYQSARGSEPIVSGIVYWEFYINTLSSNQTGFHLVVGVVPESFVIWQTYLTSNGGWGYLADGRKANNSGNGVTYAQSFCQGSTIGVLVDMNQKTISYFHNGVYQGVAFNNIDGPVYPGVSLLTGGQSVSFVENPKFPKLSQIS
ncbi:hypothetical protein DICPUDRAFT_91478 [Dictyostelium purpureum]|uniref:F-box domain-containing protein n=1 Tax=Dictyostelium purpureum TaxID=5786 RepID=F0ZD11_DICPU|nr:uncharacterized protein DICPUDRAFT_91478 [Dictyostelium purpureum]EGC38162.1 hypothetical protein DICPUDRAFT_91478 [Dictyostelium purpureum]|eukprot:XP_003285289.1 hypothetical protein DICPUDRAFT_91478 [Dictyostelium purpureum]